MPSPLTQLPADATSLARAVAQLRRQVDELRAARRAESTTISGGQGLVIAGPDGGPTIRITASADEVDASTAILYTTGLSGEADFGYMAMDLSHSPGAPGVGPALEIVTPDMGSGAAQATLQAGSPDGTAPPSIYLQAGGSTLSIDGTAISLRVGAWTNGCTYDGTTMTPFGGGWTTLPTENGWTAYGGSFQAPQCTRTVTGTVTLDGQISPGTKTVGTTVAQLPDGYLPAGGDRTYRVSAGMSGAAADIYVRSSGAIQIQTSTGTVTWLSLSGIQFPAAP